MYLGSSLACFNSIDRQCLLGDKKLEIVATAGAMNGINPSGIVHFSYKSVELRRRIFRKASKWGFLPEAFEQLHVVSVGYLAAMPVAVFRPRRRGAAADLLCCREVHDEAQLYCMI